MFRPLPYTMYGNCRDKRLSLQAEWITTSAKKQPENSIIESAAGQRRSTAPFSKGPITEVMA